MLITQFKLRDAIFLSAVLVFLTVSLKDSAIGVFLTFVLVTIYVIYRNYRLTEIIFLVYPIKFISNSAFSLNAGFNLKVITEPFLLSTFYFLLSLLFSTTKDTK